MHVIVMVMRRGMLETLQLADKRRPTSFIDFTKIRIKNKNLSSATVSKRLDELIAIGAIEEMMARSRAGRRIIAYRTTEHGKKIMTIANGLEILLNHK
jgi:predicted ArsR family transcriptional regulator